MDRNLATLYEIVAGVVGDHRALVHGGRAVSWSGFDDRAARLAAALSGLGVGPSGKVALYLYNCPEYLESMFGIFKSGGPMSVGSMVSFAFGFAITCCGGVNC